ncbi:MAG: hypothetical protein NTX91_01275 [candidate division SR1 bacterium]|nr:hypothetical protein [candidate division SR1 bacterium]
MHTTLFQKRDSFFVYLSDEDIDNIRQQKAISCDLFIKISYAEHDKSTFTLKFASSVRLAHLHGSVTASRLVRNTETGIELTVSTLFAQQQLLCIHQKWPDEVELVCPSGEKIYFYAGDGKYSSMWKKILSTQHKRLK